MKKALSLILALALCLGLAVPALALGYGEEYAGYNPTPAQQYADVPATHWAFKSINTCSERTWFNGYPDGTFRPEGLITREEAAKVFAVALDLTLDDNPTPSFTDTAGIWSTAFIEATKVLFPNTQNLQGTTSFRPTKTITREETVYALVVAWKLASKVKNVDMSILNMFSDQQTISAAVKPYIAVAVNEKLVSGLPDGTFGGQKGLSRAEFAALLARALDHGYGADDTSAPKIFVDRYAPTTTLEQVTVTGTVEPMSAGTTLTLDGRTVSLGANGAFSLDLIMLEGANVYTLAATNPYGGRGEATVSITRTVPETPEEPVEPEASTVAITNCPATTEVASVTVSGTSTNAATLTVNGAAVRLGSDGAWSTIVNLTEGANTVTVVATNSAGATASATKTVNYTPPAPPQPESPTVAITDCPAATETASVTVSGTSTNAATLTVNGVAVWIAGDGTWSGNVNLTEGANTITAVATNSAGATASATRTVTYTIPQATKLGTAYVLATAWVPGSNGVGLDTTNTKAIAQLLYIDGTVEILKDVIKANDVNLQTDSYGREMLRMLEGQFVKVFRSTRGTELASQEAVSLSADTKIVAASDFDRNLSTAGANANTVFLVGKGPDSNGGRDYSYRYIGYANLPGMTTNDAGAMIVENGVAKYVVLFTDGFDSNVPEEGYVYVKDTRCSVSRAGKTYNIVNAQGDDAQMTVSSDVTISSPGFYRITNVNYAGIVTGLARAGRYGTDSLVRIIAWGDCVCRTEDEKVVFYDYSTVCVLVDVKADGTFLESGVFDPDSDWFDLSEVGTNTEEDFFTYASAQAIVVGEQNGLASYIYILRRANPAW